MKVVVGILAAVLIAVGVLYYQGEQARQQLNRRHTETVQTLETAQQQLSVSSNQGAAAAAEVVTVRAQLAELQNSVATIGGEKTKADERVKEFQSRLAVVEKDLADEKSKLVAVEDQRTVVSGKLTSVSAELATAQKQYGDLQKTQQATVADLDESKGKVIALEQERASLERQLNDIDTLRTQVRLVKHRLWEEHVVEWKKRDTDTATGGNSGVLLKNGQWQSGSVKPAS